MEEKKLFAIEHNIDFDFDENIFNEKEDTIRKKAEDFFDSESENKNEISSFTSDEEIQIEIKNEIEVKKDLSRRFKKENIYLAEEITNQLDYLKKKKKRNFLKEFQLKKLKFKDSDSTFTIDLFKNKDNYLYGSLQIKDIPIYRRINVNKIIGIKNAKLSEEILEDLNIMINQKNIKSNKKENKRYYLFEHDRNPIILKCSKQFDKKNEFITFDNKQTDMVKIDINDLSIDYSKIGSEVDRIYLEKNKEFNKKIHDQPKNVKIWLDYISFQDEIKNNEVAKIEIKLNIIEKSLKYNPDDLILNLIYLRLIQDGNYDFNFINNQWIAKLEILKMNENFLHEYLKFIKYQHKLSISDVREHYQFILRFYDNEFKKVNDVIISKLIIDIILDYICLEKEAGYYERSFNILRSLIEIKVLLHKKIFKGKYNDDYIIYFESEYPKIGDFKDSIGYIDYIQSSNAIDEEYFNRPDFIDNYKESKKTESNEIYREINSVNFRSLNIIYDKENIETQSESFIFFSDIKNFIEITFSLNNETILYLIIKSLEYLGINGYKYCYSCRNKVTKFNSDDRILYDRKYIMFPKLYNFNRQLFEYYIRIFDYLDCMNIHKEKIKKIKMEIYFLNKNENFENKINYAKNLFKEDQNNIKLWINYYKWCNYFKKYDDCEKILKSLNRKNFNQVDSVKISLLNLNHHINKYIMKENKLDDIKLILLQNINNYLSCDYKDMSNLNLISIINKLENLFNDSINSISRYYLLLCYVFAKQFFKLDDIINKFKIISSKFAYNPTNCCKDHLKREKFLLFIIKIFEIVRNEYEIKSKHYELLLEHFNIIVPNNDIFIYLYSKILCRYSNTVDREMRFINFFSNRSSLKHFYYFLNNRYKESQFPIKVLQIYCEYWKIANKNLYKVSKRFNEENYDINYYYHPLTFLKYWNSILKQLHKKEYMKYLEFSLFKLHEYSYSKYDYMKFYSLINIQFEDDSSKFIKDINDLIIIKEIRFNYPPNCNN